MSRVHGIRKQLSTTWSPSQWSGSHSLGLVHELNDHCLEVLTHIARTNSACGTKIVSIFRDQWRDLDEGSRRRAAGLPVLVLDLHFRSEDFWHWARTHRSGDWKNMTVGQNCFPPRFSSELMRETLMLAWHTARTDINAAGVLLGMPQKVANAVAAFGLHDIDRIANRHARYLRPRWENRPAFWDALLRAAKSADEEVLADIHLHSLQLLARN